MQYKNMQYELLLEMYTVGIVTGGDFSMLWLATI
jgi:hypothetical protein